MKAVLISINKPHTDNIFTGDKSLEWRKKPLPECLHYVYETKNKGGCAMVIGEMRIVGSVAIDTSGPLPVGLVNAGCVHPAALKEYANNGTVYANFIKDAKRYDKPKQLSEFERPCKCTGEYEGEVYCDCLNCDDAGDSDYGIIGCDRKLKKPPQSWCHVEELE